MSLSDELLADFEDEGMNMDGSEKPGLPAISEEMETDELKDVVTDTSGNVRNVAKLYGSQRLNVVMKDIEDFSKRERGAVSGPVEMDPEYQVIVEANQMTVEIDDELSK